MQVFSRNDVRQGVRHWGQVPCLQKELEDKIASEMIANYDKPITKVTLSADGDEILINVT